MFRRGDNVSELNCDMCCKQSECDTTQKECLKAIEKAMEESFEPQDYEQHILPESVRNKIMQDFTKRE
jgi:hypothetical protein